MLKQGRPRTWCTIKRPVNLMIKASNDRPRLVFLVQFNSEPGHKKF